MIEFIGRWGFVTIFMTVGTAKRSVGTHLGPFLVQLRQHQGELPRTKQSTLISRDTYLCKIRNMWMGEKCCWTTDEDLPDKQKLSRMLPLSWSECCTNAQCHLRWSRYICGWSESCCNWQRKIPTEGCSSEQKGEQTAEGCRWSTTMGEFKHQTWHSLW